jgi:hypothetical protein
MLTHINKKLYLLKCILDLVKGQFLKNENEKWDSLRLEDEFYYFHNTVIQMYNFEINGEPVAISISCQLERTLHICRDKNSL